jgi:hypothetical protein
MAKRKVRITYKTTNKALARALGRRRRKVNIPRPLFSRNKLVSLRYVWQGALDASSGGLASKQFYLNGLYDPEVAVGGHQPRGFDQLMAAYGRYTVVGAKAQMINLNNDASNDSPPQYFGMKVSPNSTEIANYSCLDLIESRQLVKFAEGGILYPSIHKGSSIKGRPQVMKKWSAKKHFGGSVVGDYDHSGTSSVNPATTSLAILDCWVGHPSSGVNPASGSYLVIIDYVALFTEPLRIGPS